MKELNLDAACRFMCAAAAVDVLRVYEAYGSEMFELNAAGQTLRSDAVGSTRDWVVMINSETMAAWCAIDSSAREQSEGARPRPSRSNRGQWAS